MTRPFLPGLAPPGPPSEQVLLFAFRGAELLVEENGSAASIPGAERPIGHYLGRLGEVDCYTEGLEAEAEAPAGAAFRGLRSLYGLLDEDLYAVAGRAFQIVEWDRTHRFCGSCGTPTEDSEGERAKRCPGCRHLAFPRLSPAVIVAVRRGRELLLARGNAFPEQLYSVLAGFVDPGESLEETVVRELREEVGIEVRNVRYFGSQPWPYPHSLMIGFTAEYAGGEIAIDRTEIADAGWFAPERLPEHLPGRLSIARRLVDAFLAEQ